MSGPRGDRFLRVLLLFTGHTSTVGPLHGFGGVVDPAGPRIRRAQRLTAYEVTTWPPPRTVAPVSSSGRTPKPARDIGMPVPARTG